MSSSSSLDRSRRRFIFALLIVLASTLIFSVIQGREIERTTNTREFTQMLVGTAAEMEEGLW